MHIKMHHPIINGRHCSPTIADKLFIIIFQHQALLDIPCAKKILTTYGKVLLSSWTSCCSVFLDDGVEFGK